MPHDEVSKRYGVQRARVKELQESAGKFALMVAAFCECLGWSNLDLLISQFQVLSSLCALFLFARPLAFLQVYIASYVCVYKGTYV